MSCYEVLGLTGPTSSHSPQDIKAAYKKALLLHHPDKKKEEAVKSSSQSVDAITAAYKRLSDPPSRAEHDRELILQARNKLNPQGHTGLETLDLDDLDVVRGLAGKEDSWNRDCRCGRTYTITESQLEQEAEKGEIYVPCEGCSLCLHVLFQASDET